MIDTPRIVEVPHQLTAVIRLTVPRAQIQQVMDPAIREVLAAITSQGVGPAGPMVSYHLRLSPEAFDFEVGFPVRAPVRPVGRVVSSELPAARVVRTIYRGPYEGLGQAWPEFMKWIAKERHTTAESIWERYVKGPESTANAAEYETELNRALLEESAPNAR